MSRTLVAIDVGFGAIKVVAGNAGGRKRMFQFPALVQAVPRLPQTRRPSDIFKPESGWHFAFDLNEETHYLIGVGAREMSLESRRQFSPRTQALVLTGIYRALRYLGANLNEKNTVSLVLGVPPGIHSMAKKVRWPETCYINLRPFRVHLFPVYIVSQTAGTVYLFARRLEQKRGTYVFCDIGYGTTDIVVVDITSRGIVALSQVSHEVGCNEIEGVPSSMLSEREAARQNVAYQIAQQISRAIRQAGMNNKEVTGIVLTGGGSVQLSGLLSEATSMSIPLSRIGNTVQDAVFANALGMWEFLRDKMVEKT